MSTHSEKHFTSSDFIRDVVIGMADGLTVPFALAAGLSGAISSNKIIITAGVAEIIAGSIAMGLGGYLAGKTDYDHYFSELKREYFEVEKYPEKEKEEVREVLEEYGISGSSQKLVVDEMALDKDKWVKFMMRFELGLEEPHLSRARNSAITIAVSYVVGGFIPLSPYFFTESSLDALTFSVAITLLALFVFGYFKSKATGQPAFWGALKTTAIGALAASAAFLIAKWIA
ncbi:MAG: iron transporter [Sphingobacteriaceae bacterium]|jgi:VIT1/CCC1 family predicted Fe2+/Mn2+ transporter|nr:iron transporter [Sphingobacteriaceae bacterium]